MPVGKQRQLGAALRNAGYESKRVTRKGEKRSLWFAPVAAFDTALDDDPEPEQTTLDDNELF